MSNVPALKPKPKCLRHDYMAFMGKYDYNTDEYKHSCGEMQCPRHGRGACRQRYHKKKKALHPRWGFTTIILFFNHKPSSGRLAVMRSVIRKHIRSWDRHARICMILHPKKKCWHLNIGIQSKWVFRMKNLNCWSQYVEERVVGYWDDHKYHKPRGRPRVADFEVMFKRLEAEIQQLCANPALNSRRPPRLEVGQFRNQPRKWLWYVLRCKAGWKSVEKLPRRMGYRLTSGFVVRKKKIHVPPINTKEPVDARFSSALSFLALWLMMSWMIAGRRLAVPDERDWCSCCPTCLSATMPPALFRAKARSPPRPWVIVEARCQQSRTVFTNDAARLPRPGSPTPSAA